MAFKLKYGKQSAFPFKTDGKTSAQIRKEKFDAKNLENLKKGKYGRDISNAIQYDKYTDSGHMYDPTGKYKRGTKNYTKLTQKLEYGKVKATDDSPQSGEFVRRFTLPGEHKQRNRTSHHQQASDKGKPIMTSWNDQNPVQWDPDRGEYYTRSRNPYEWGDTKEEGLKNIKNLGTLPGQGFTDSQIRRVEGAWRYNKVGGPSRSYTKSVKKELTGRAKVKGKVKKHIESGGVGGQNYREAKESYMEGENITKTTRRMKGSLNIQRDKVKRKKKGFVRKTGEGFLGLQNRKKYIDGVEVKRGRHKGSTNLKNTRGKTIKKVDNSGITGDMPDIVVTPKMQKKRDRKANRVAKRNKRKENLAQLNRDVKNYREKNYGI